MNVLWKKGSATVGEVVEALPANPPLAYSTVLTMLRILESKGYLRHTKEGRAFIYQPVVDQREASSNAIRYLVSRFFGGSPGKLVLNLLEDEQLDAEELKRISKLIGESNSGDRR
jgi:predicted transcriptional regulator